MTLHVKFSFFALGDLFGGRLCLDLCCLDRLNRFGDEVRLFLEVSNFGPPFVPIARNLAPTYAFGFVHKILLGRADPLDSHRPFLPQENLFQKAGKPFVALSPARSRSPLVGEMMAIPQ